MRGAVFGVLGGLCALAFITYLLAPAAPAVPFTVTLGAPAPRASADSPPPLLSMDLAFSGDGTRLISRRANGEVVAWGLASGAPHGLASAPRAFAYCAARDLLLVGDEDGVTLTSLNDGASRTVGDAPADHAAMSADCETLALARADESKVMIWSFAPRLRVMTAETRKPARNGLALSPDGVRIAAATGLHGGAAGHEAGLETFVIPPWGDPAPGPVIDDAGVVGIWRIAFSPDGAALYAGSQAEGRAGLRAFSTETDAAFWGYDGFDADWVRALAISPDGAVLATGDDSGMLRLWDADTGAMLYEGSTGQVIQSLAFSGDGARLAAGLWDTTIRVADMATLLK